MNERLEAYAAKMRIRNAERSIQRRHGTLTRYALGCRCAFCRSVNRSACRRYSATKQMLLRFRRMGRNATDR